MVKLTGDKPSTLPAPPHKETKPGAPTPPHDLQPLTDPPPIDPFQAVDSGGRAINLGDYVDLYFCKVVGFKPDGNNRLNVWVVPTQNAIITNDPTNPLTGQLDGKAMLVSGYSTVSYPPPSGDPTTLSAPPAAITAIATNIQKAKDIANGTTPPPSLPSNFLAPSLT